LATLLRIVLFPFLAYLPIKALREESDARDTLERTLVDFVTTRIEEVKAAGGQIPPTKYPTIVDAMLASRGTPFEMSEADMKGQALTFTLAGYETTSTALSWALYALSQHRDVQDRLREEIVSGRGRLLLLGRFPISV
jgi:cytochrome P450